MKDQLDNNSTAVILLSGNGLKDIESASKIVDTPKPFDPDIDSIINKLKN
jgi:hypothetical protein